MAPYLLHKDGEPSSLPELPGWGYLALDIYILEEWDTPHPNSFNETSGQRRKRLVRQFLELGTAGRLSYYDRAEPTSDKYSPLEPSQSQIETILQPLRPECLRQFALWADAPEGLWIRTCYDKELEQNHQSLWNNYVVYNHSMDTDALILDDAELFAGDWSHVLEIFPERVTKSCDESYNEAQNNSLAELQENEDDTADDAEAQKSERELLAELGPREFQQHMCRGYRQYHVDCVVTHMFVEDKYALEGNGLLHVFLDDCGNVVRQLRVEPGWVDNFDAAWVGGHWDEAYFEDAEVGPAYLPGGVRGPPYGQGRGPHWLQLITYGAEGTE